MKKNIIIHTTAALLGIYALPLVAMYYNTPYESINDAADYWDWKAITIFLNHGADINTKDNNGESLLHLAVRAGDQEAVAYLLKRKDMNINVLDSSDLAKTPLHLASVPPWHNTTMVDMLLQRADIDINAKDIDGITPLHFATYWGLIEIVAALLNHPDIDVNAPTQGKRCTPLHMALGRDLSVESPEIALMLIQREDCNVNAADSDGNTPLHLAHLLRVDVIKALLQRSDIDLHAVNNQGKTPLEKELSHLYPDADLVTLLQEKINAEYQDYAVSITCNVS